MLNRSVSPVKERVRGFQKDSLGSSGQKRGKDTDQPGDGGGLGHTTGHCAGHSECRGISPTVCLVHGGGKIGLLVTKQDDCFAVSAP